MAPVRIAPCCARNVRMPRRSALVRQAAPMLADGDGDTVWIGLPVGVIEPSAGAAGVVVDGCCGGVEVDGCGLARPAGLEQPAINGRAARMPNAAERRNMIRSVTTPEVAVKVLRARTIRLQRVDKAAVGVGMGVGAGVGIGALLGVAAGVGMVVGVLLGVGEGAVVGDGEAVGVADGVGVGDGVAVGLGVGVGELLGVGEGVLAGAGGSTRIGDGAVPAV